MTTRLRVLSYNIHKGFSAGNREFLLEGIRDAIRTTQADIACLQEVIGDHKKHPLRHRNWHPGSQFEFLADSVWHHFAYGKNAIYQDGHHGNAMLSKYPLQQYRNIDITRWKFSQRGILHGQIGNRLHVLCIHLGFLPFEQNFQLQALIDFVREQIPVDHALIIAGDFNDWHFRIHNRLCKSLGLKEATSLLSHGKGRPLATYPAHKPRLPMDRIYYRNITCSHSEILHQSHWQSLSDHCPVIADFVLAEPLTGETNP